MKRMLADYWGRMRWHYLFGMAFIVMIDMLWTSYATDAHSSFMFVVIFMLPPMFDLKRGHTEVMRTLPLTRETVAHYYWGVVVLLPALVVAAAFVAAGLGSACFFSAPPFATLMSSFASVVLASLVWAAASFCILTFFPPTVPEEVNGFAGIWMLLWLPTAFLGIGLPTAFLGIGLPTAFLGIGLPNLADIRKLSAPAWEAAALLGVVLVVWSYSRSEKLVMARGKARRGEAEAVGRKVERVPVFKPDRARFGRIFFEVAWGYFQFGLIFAGLMLVFKAPMGKIPVLSALLFALCAFASTGRLSRGIRLLRSLPLSASRLALTLCLLPISSMLGIISAISLLDLAFPGHVVGSHPVSYLIPKVGAVCFASSLAFPVGERSLGCVVLPLGMLGAFVVFISFLDAARTPAFWWLLGFGLMAGAFFLNRHWLRCSESYRTAPGGFARR